MEIVIWDGGLQEHEVFAIEKIKATFSPFTSHIAGKKIPLADFQNNKKNNGMFPWKGYAGFRFVNSKGKEGEFDLVILTHCNVLIVELKHWNNLPITSCGDIWYKGNQNMGRSPVSITRDKKFTLDNKLKKLTQRFTNKGYKPFVDFFVVMTGNSDFKQLPEDQLRHTISLEDFLKFADNQYFHQYFNPPTHPKVKMLNKDFPIFDELFLGSQTKPKSRNYAGYTAKEEILVHPKKVYKEYLANAESYEDLEAILRVWNFNKVEGGKGYTPEWRANIVARERQILNHIHHRNRELYNHCLRALTSFQKDEITAEYNEVYELPPGHLRFNEFIGKFSQTLREQDRFNLSKLLIAKFAELHEMKIAHRDIADHSIWLSGTKEIALSNFISAYHQPIGTVGDYRKVISVGAVKVENMLDEESITPFKQDVHSLGVIVWHLLQAKIMNPRSLKTIIDDMTSSEQWYAIVLLDAMKGKFATATELFDALIEKAPVMEEIPTFDDTELDPYRRPISHFRQYREDSDLIIETSEKEVYISEGRLVKAWLGIDSNDNTSKQFELLSFLRRVDKLRAINPTYLPQIRDYGIATRSNSLYLVTDKIEGTTWENSNITVEQQLEVIKQLLAAVEHLHSQGLAHGDIHPNNVMLNTEKNKVYLIDIPDFSHLAIEVKNHRYSPDNIDTCTPFERDNFAVMKMSCELLEVTWGGESEIYPALATAIQEELQDSQFRFSDLGRFKTALLGKTPICRQEIIEIIGGNASEPVTILPDNGRLFVKVERKKDSESAVRVTFFGIGASFAAYYDLGKQEFLYCLSPRDQASISCWQVENSNFDINLSLRVIPGFPGDVAPLTSYLRSNENFLNAIDFLNASVKKNDNEVRTISDELKFSAEKLECTTSKSNTSPIDISTEKLWRAILNTEAESNPNIEVAGPVLPSKAGQGDLIIPYSTKVDPLDSFKANDEVEAYQVDADGNEKFIGMVSLQFSVFNEIRIVNARMGAWWLREGEVVYFRSKQDRASYRKRKAALERLLDKQGVLPELIDLFEPSNGKSATDYNIVVTDEDFSQYDHYDQLGNRISLNIQQREAFSKLVNYGPLSLLQGPPGTGKTEFIAAFIHYLLEKQGVKRILLVSQSHEAVNTATERIRKHCLRLGTELEVVRFSNREGAVSDGLKDVYSTSITNEKRALFEAEYRHRVKILSTAFGLDSEFIASLLQAELKVFKQIDNLDSLINCSYQEIDKSDIEDLKKAALDLEQSIRLKVEVDYGLILSDSESVLTAKDQIIEKLCHDFAIRPHQVTRARALARISRDMLDAWSGERVNCDEFYARSRHLIAGTCVGIGQGHIGIADNIYDWVIIDEAARSIASELAIAMQSAKRVLLVGDHLQLPPLYSDAHKKALARKLNISGNKNGLDEIFQSDFARAFNSEYGKQASASLLTQYRMAPAIGNLVSETFYEGKLRNGNRVVPDIYNKAPEALKNTVTWLDTSALGKKANHTEAKGNSKSISNRCEADLIINLLKQIDNNETFVEELSEIASDGEAVIGIICMYAEQKHLIRKKFNQEVWAEGFKRLVKIDTVDSYQGKENRVIILSLTRSNKRQSPGFLRTPNRINVAMSRAMDRLLIVGNSKIWTGKNKELPLGLVVNHMLKNRSQNDYHFVQATLCGKR